jgi:hypothetical protein
MANAQVITAAITAALQTRITAATVTPAAPVTVVPAAPIPFACTPAQARADLLDYELLGEAKTYLTSKPAAGTTRSVDKPEAPTKAPTKATEKPTSKLVVEPTATPVSTKSTPKLVAKPTTKPATTLNAITKLATTFSVNKTNVSITELGDCYQSDCALLHTEKKLPATVQKKLSPPTKKLNFAKATRLKTMNKGTQSRKMGHGLNEWKCWHMILENLNKLTITTIFLSVLVPINGGNLCFISRPIVLWGTVGG